MRITHVLKVVRIRNVMRRMQFCTVSDESFSPNAPSCNEMSGFPFGFWMPLASGFFAHSQAA